MIGKLNSMQFSCLIVSLLFRCSLDLTTLSDIRAVYHRWNSVTRFEVWIASVPLDNGDQLRGATARVQEAKRTSAGSGHGQKHSPRGRQQSRPFRSRQKVANCAKLHTEPQFTTCLDLKMTRGRCCATHTGSYSHTIRYGQIQRRPRWRFARNAPGRLTTAIGSPRRARGPRWRRPHRRSVFPRSYVQ